jgi:alpha-L-arabinofuranosidase
MLYRKQYGTVPVPVSGNYSLAGLDVVAAWTEDRKTLTIGVVNPHEEEKVVNVNLPDVKLSGRATVWRIAGDDSTAHNSVASRPVAIDGPHDIALDGKVKVPPYSVSLYRLPDTASNN